MQGWALQTFEDHMKRAPTNKERIEIEKAIKMVGPYGVDICSGVEKEPGIKDYNKMQELISTIQKN